MFARFLKQFLLCVLYNRIIVPLPGIGKTLPIYTNCPSSKCHFSRGRYKVCAHHWDMKQRSQQQTHTLMHCHTCSLDLTSLNPQTTYQYSSPIKRINTPCCLITSSDSADRYPPLLYQISALCYQYSGLCVFN